jgi:adenylate cyclase
MTETFAQEDGNAELWSTIFSDGHPDLLKQHRLHRMMPSPPRCRLCKVPFKGIGGWWFSRRGKQPSSRNQHYCAACDGFLDGFPGGAEVEMAILFVDIRNSTAFAEGAEPKQVSDRVTAFLDTATDIITDNP